MATNQFGVQRTRFRFQKHTNILADGVQFKARLRASGRVDAVALRFKRELKTTQLGPQVSQSRFSTLIVVHAIPLQAVVTSTTRHIDKRFFKAVPAVKPLPHAMEVSQVFFVTQHFKSGECGIGHDHGFDGLLIVSGLLLAMDVPSVVPYGPEEIVDRRRTVKEFEGVCRDFEKILFGPAFPATNSAWGSTALA